MPIIRDFIYQEDEESGLLGLLPTWMPKANTTTAIAHDVLEHFFPRELTAAEDELVALGALLALRIENGVFHNYYTYAEQLAQTVSSVLTDIDRDSLPVPRPCPSRRLSDDYRWADDLILEAVPKSIAAARRELSDAEEPWVLADTSALEQAIVGYLRKGYRKAVRRFASADLYTIGASLFKKLDACSKKLVDSDMLREGDRVRVMVDPRRGQVWFKVNGRSAEAYGF